MYEKFFIILLDKSSVRDIQVNFKDDKDENYEDYFTDILIDKVEADSLNQAIEIVAAEHEINPDKLYGYEII